MSGTGPAVWLKQCSMLVAEDSASSRAVIGALLERAGVRDVTMVENGREVLAALEKRPFDLILLDILMPDMDGFKTCRALRRDPRYVDLPVLAMTGLGDAGKRAMIFAAGATDLILKPIHPGELLARITSQLQNQIMLRNLRAFHDRASAELGAARLMQEGLLPNETLLRELEARYGVSLASLVMPCAELAGDLWCAWPIDDARFGVFAVDVMGHGTIAAINAFRIHALLWQDMKAVGEPGEFLTGLNQRLKPLLPTGQFATAFYAVFDVEGERIDYAAAGYTNPVLGGAGRRRVLDGTGLPLGISAAAKYGTRQAPWAPGRLLLLYSDALSEMRGADGAILGEEGALRLCARAQDARSADRTIKALARSLGEMSALEDDLTLVCVARAGA